MILEREREKLIENRLIGREIDRQSDKKREKNTQVDKKSIPTLFGKGVNHCPPLSSIGIVQIAIEKT